MPQVKLTIKSPDAFLTGIEDGWKEFVNTLYGTQSSTCWEIANGRAISTCGTDNQITNNQITFSTKGANPSKTTLFGNFKFSKKQKAYPYIDVKGVITGYESKISAIGSGFDYDGNTVVTTEKLKTKIHKVIKSKIQPPPNSSVPEYSGGSFVTDGIINYSKNLNVTTNNPNTFSYLERSSGKSNYSIVDHPYRSNLFGLKLDKSKDTIDLTRIGDDRIAIENFDYKKDKIIVNGDYFIMKARAHEGAKLYLGSTQKYQGMIIPGNDSQQIAEFFETDSNGYKSPVQSIEGMEIKSI